MSGALALVRPYTGDRVNARSITGGRLPFEADGIGGWFGPRFGLPPAHHPWRGASALSLEPLQPLL